MGDTRQTNFGGGEVSPFLWGRTDLPIFGRALRSCLNFFISKQGAAVSRPGTTFVGELKNSPIVPFSVGGPYIDRAVLIPFIAADDEAFVLEFGINYIRFIAHGGYVLDGGGNPYEVRTPYEYADLRKLHYSQVGEVLTVVCPNWDAYELRHVSDVPVQWTFTQAVTARPSIVDSFYEVGTPTSPAVGFLIDRSQGGGLQTPDADHPAREWQWQVTAVVKDADTGELFETLPATVSESYDSTAGATYETGNHAALASNKFPVYQDMPVTLDLLDSAALVSPVNVFTIVSYNIYRGRGGLYGYVGSTASRQFVDVGDVPDFATRPPQGTDPFGTTGTATLAAAPFNVIHDDRASAVAYYEQRRVFGGISRREQDIIASATGDFDNFDQNLIYHLSGESLIFTVAARKRGRIKHLVPMDRLVVLSSQASWHGGGQVGSPLDFDSVDFRHIEEVGASDVTPLVVDGTVIFVRSKGHGVHGLISGGQDAGFKGFDVGMFAEHLFRGESSTIIDMTYAHDPWGVIWAVREDGVLLSLTYQREEMLAWARHEMDGTVESVCAIPEGDEDAVYLIVAREIQGTTHRYVERMTSRHERGGAVLTADAGAARSLDLQAETPPDYICVDCAVMYVGPSVDTFTGLDHLEGKSVYVVVQGQAVRGPFTVNGGSITLPHAPPANVTDADDAPSGPRLVAAIGMLYQPELELLDVAGGAARNTYKQVSHVGFEVDNAQGVQVGPDFDNLTRPPVRTVSSGFGAEPLRTEVVRCPVAGKSDLSARAVLRQAYPLPVTVVGISRVLKGGDAP
jgi:hypothetical protein